MFSYLDLPAFDFSVFRVSHVDPLRSVVDEASGLVFGDGEAVREVLDSFPLVIALLHVVVLLLIVEHSLFEDHLQ